MKNLMIPAFVLLIVTAFCQPTKKNAPYHMVKTFYTDLNNDHLTDTITLSSNLAVTENFNKIIVSLSGSKKQVFRAKDYWTGVDKEFLDSNKNALRTDLLFLKKTDQHTVILLFGESYGSGARGEFSIINIENKQVKMVFDHDDDKINVEWAVRLTDLENNGRLCFVYTQLGELYGYDEKSNGDIGTYSPYYVYPVTDTCTLNKPLTKKYNQDNYVFAGYSYSEKIRILYPRNKKRKPSVYKKKY